MNTNKRKTVTGNSSSKRQFRLYPICLNFVFVGLQMKINNEKEKKRTITVNDFGNATEKFS